MEKKLLWRLGSFSIYLLSNCAELSTTYMVPTYVVCTHNHYLVFWRLSFKIRLCISLHVYVSSMNVSAYIMLVFSIIVELKDQIQKENIMEMFSHLSPSECQIYSCIQHVYKSMDLNRKNHSHYDNISLFFKANILS